MLNININKVSQEIKDKYSIVSNSFRLDKIKNAELDKYTGEPKDEINTIIGDDKQTDFFPQIKLQRWSNETNFSVRLIDNEIGEEKVSTLKDKIKWSKGNIDIDFYDYTEGEGGYKMVWWLKEKPATNKVKFSIQSKGLKFCYQPRMDAGRVAEEKAIADNYPIDWSDTEFIKRYYNPNDRKEGFTETEEIDKDGNVVASKPENVVGSYAVYHSTKGGMVDSNGKAYATGKAFHIYRPKIIDAEGNEAWGILKIENGIYEVEIPQEFLDTCKFPIFANDTFGYTSVGGSETTDAGSVRGSLFTSPSNVDTADNINAYIKEYGEYIELKGLIILHSDGNVITNGVGGEVSIGSSYDWITSTFATSPSLSGNTDYVLAEIDNAFSGYIYIKYDTGATNQGHRNYDFTGGYTNPTGFSENLTHNTDKYSIYATYTASSSDPEPNVNDQLNITEDTTVELEDLDISVSDDITITDELVYWEESISISEYVNVEITVGADIGTSESDQLNITEDTTVELEDLDISVSDDISISEDISTTISDEEVGVSDDISVSEDTSVSVQASTAFEINVSDQLNLSEDTDVEVEATATPEINVSDQLNITENVDAEVGAVTALNVSVSDQLNISEDITTTVSDLETSVSDDMSVSEDIGVETEDPTAFDISVSDQLNITEDTTLTTEDLEIDTSDQLNITEDVNAELQAITTPEINTSDQLNITESVDVEVEAPITPEISVSDDITISEDTGLEVEEAFGVNVYDSITISEDITTTISDLEVDVYDGLSMSEYLAFSGIWAFQAKNTASWTEQTKNTASWTEQSKNSSDWTYQNKS
jgi:hypothetical protein